MIDALQAFGKPIWINEIGIRPDFPGTPDRAVTFVYNDLLKALLSIAPKYDIESLRSSSTTILRPGRVRTASF